MNGSFPVLVFRAGVSHMFFPVCDRPDGGGEVSSPCQVYAVMLKLCVGGPVPAAGCLMRGADYGMPFPCVYFFVAAFAFSMLTSSTVKIKVE